MKKFLVGAVIVVALLAGVGGLALGGFAMKTVFENQTVDTVTTELETDVTEVAGYTPGEPDTVALLKNELAGGNTKLVWETGKVQAGSRKDFDGTWTSLGGAVVYDAEAKALKALEVAILIESFNGYGSTTERAPGGLVNTVLGKGVAPPSGYDPWFNWVDYPEAVFTSSAFVKRTDDTEAGHPNAPEGWTHLIEGTFELNGTTGELAIPAIVTFDGAAVTIDARFTVSREAYGVVPVNPLPLTEVDDLIEITAVVNAKPDSGLVIDGLAALIGEQGTLIGAQQQTIADLQKQIAIMSETLASLDRKIASGAAAAKPQIDLASLPKSITDQIAYPGKDPIAFEMILVPGEGDIAPFYMGKHEVTWEMFYDWAYGADIDANQYAQLQAKNLRPSPLYEDCNQLKLGLGKRPALSMSRTTAEGFAKWVSEQTGRSYRVPTDAEWMHALKLGGGVPDTKEELFAQACLIDNAEIQFDPPFLELTDVVGTKKPNKLGIHDMLGNAAEWVVDTAADRVVRGGHFMLDASELTAAWKAVENQDVWNETYPQLPVSKFWYRDHYYQGFRLVADIQ
ncbi:MAG: SUMF1/EgtB/PvdO family nonheme iron enzyme [Phycisphaeraceae bacterium]